MVQFSVYTASMCSRTQFQHAFFNASGRDGRQQCWGSSDPVFPLVRNAGNGRPKTEEEAKYAKKTLSIRIHDAIGVKFDRSGNISYLHNGKDRGVAFRGLKSRYVRPAAAAFIQQHRV